MSTPIVTINTTGISAPPFAAVLAYLQDSYRAIYGQDIVIDPDTQDGQWLGIIANALNDMNSSAVAAFNGFIPTYALGAGLSSIVKINGIKRQIASASLVTLTLGGTQGTIITNALVADNLNLNSQWFISQTVVIPASGTIDILAVCTSPGAVVAAAGTLTQIMTPIPGWQTATNNAAATPGAPIETDAQLRRRQTKSTALPALTVLPSIQGNLLALPGMVRAKVFQNDTLVTDANGIPPRSIACVTQGGDPRAIASTIAATKAPGVPTYGNSSMVVYDQTGTPNHINYWQLTPVPISALVWLTAIVGYTSQVSSYIQQALAEYFSSLEIGQHILLGDVYSPANLDGDAAIIGTSLLQTQLDPLGATYSIDAPYGLALSRAGMEAAGGPYSPGATVIGVGYGGYFTLGEVVWLTLDSATFFRAVVTAVAAASITISPGIPSTQTITAGNIIYGVGDLTVLFNEAAIATVDNITLNPH